VRGRADTLYPYQSSTWFTYLKQERPKSKKRKIMKPEIHPEYKETQVTCGCGEKFVTRSTVASGSIYVEVCSVCHPFYTGKQRILDTGGRVAKFEERFGKKTAN
jgi:large subunit ribosomal protein L31